MKYKLIISVRKTFDPWTWTGDSVNCGEHDIDYEKCVEYETAYALQSNITNMGINGLFLDADSGKTYTTIYIPPHKINNIKIIPL